MAWDNVCGVPFLGLSLLLATYASRDRAGADLEIERLIDSYPSQRMEALKARAILIAADAARETDLAQLDLRVARLPEGDMGFLPQVPRLKEMVAEIALLQRRLATVSTPAFREPLASELVQKIEAFSSRVSGFRYPLADGFREAAAAWLGVARRQLDEARRVLETAPVAEVFRAGDPVDRAREAFLPRMGVIEELQGQATLRLGCPGLLLYGRRRMGKSTLIRNLQPLLPPSVGVDGISMQDPRAFTSLASLAGLWARWWREPFRGSARSTTRATCLTVRGARQSRRGAGGERPPADPRRRRVRMHRRQAGRRHVSPRAPRYVPRSVQRHRHLVWLFAGSHDLSELRHAEWPSYFVSLRTIELLPFGDADTRLLLTDPLRHSSLFDRDDPRRPRFDAAFWGEGGIERIQAEAAGWPHLVQLLAEGVVELVNLRGQKAATTELLDEAISKAVVRGDAVLRQLVRNECRLDGEWEYLKGFRSRELQPPPADEAVFQSLRRRLMVAEEAGHGGCGCR